MVTVTALGKTFYDAFVFAAICFIIFLISAQIVWTDKLEGAELDVSMYLGLSVFLMSFSMMCLSGKYFDNPITNHSSYTPWTWWKFKN